MILTLQCTATCRACGHETTPINGVASEVPCRRCGAALMFAPALWDVVFEGLSGAATDLAHNGSGHDQFVVDGASLRVGFHRVDPQCPHCNAAWSDVPGGGAWACPHCRTAISLRAGPDTEYGPVTLIAEDRGLVSPEGLALRCSGCGSPLDIGAERRTRCGACGSDNVVPDELFRRVNAPDLAARWMVRVAEAAGPHPLTGVHVHHLALGSDGVLYIVGSTSHLDFALLAFDPRARTLLWTLNLGECDGWPIPVVAGGEGGRVALVWEMGRELRFARAGAIEPGFDAGELILDATFHAGDLLLCLHPMHTLARFGLDGTKRDLWPPIGLFSRVFGGGGELHPSEIPKRRPRATFPGRIGVGHDGDLRMIWGTRVVRYSSAGEVLWSTPIPEALVGTTAPVAAADGTTYAVVSVGQDDMRNRLIRLRPDGGIDAVVLDADYMAGLACEADGRVWVMAGHHEDGVGSHLSLQCYDVAGTLIWKASLS